MLRHSLELSMRLHHQGNFVQASKKQVKSLYLKLEEAAHILDIKSLPELYVVQDSRVNAYTFGVEKCSIAISSGCLELLSDDEVKSVLAHELGHIKAEHVLYKTASRILASLADSLAQKTLGLGGLVLYPLQIALLRWDRASELSSDRASLLVVKNPLTVLNSMMKLAGGTLHLKAELNIASFIAQAEAFEKTQEEGPLGKYIAVMNSMFNTHPFPIWRAKEIIEWVESGDYFAILQGHYPKAKQFSPGLCLNCQEKLSPNGLCLNCGNEEQTKSYEEKIDHAFKGLKSWYDKNFNVPKD
jgi:Zn-dependent protease with chaperone function